MYVSIYWNSPVLWI